jgi:dTDP-glucose 4,6-dehydratase
MSSVLVTGGAGFIGSNFVRMLVESTDDEIVIVDKLTYAGNLPSIEDVLSERCRFVQGDIADASAMEALFEKERFHRVINFAAESHVDRSISDPQVFIRTNILGVQVLLEACRKYDVQKFVQVSTDEVYGSLGETGLFTEESPLDPSSPYSASKTSADLLVQAWHKTYGLPVNITRCSNNYGPYQYPEKLIPLMLLKALNTETLPVYGDGSNVRDWIHVEDHCRALKMVLEHGVSGRVYNIGGNCERDNLTVVKRILEVVDKPRSLIQFVEDRKGHDWRYAIDNTRIQQELDWKPSHTFEDGLRATLEWYMQNELWWKPLLEES